MSLQDSVNRGARTSPANATELLITLRKRYPNETKEEIVARFAERALDDDGIVREIARSYAVLNWRITEPATPRPTRPTAAQRTAQDTAARKIIQERVTEIVLLDVLIGDKKLREMTFKECSAWGGSLSRIAKQGKPNQKVGDVLSEKKVRELWDKR